MNFFRIISYPFSVLYKIYDLLYFSLSLILFYPLFLYYLNKEERFSKAFKILRIFVKQWLLFTGVFVKTKGKENLNIDGPFVIAANHSSFLDPAIIYSIYDKHFVFTGKQEIEKWPLFHIFYTSGMNILVDRKNRIGALKSFKKMMDVIDSGKPLVILPEGTISEEAPKLTDFKTGAVSLAIQKNVPIVPITFTTNWKRLQRKGLFSGKASPGIAEAIIHEPIITKGMDKTATDMLNSRLKEVINQPLQELYNV